MVVYVDILFLENFIVNLFLLYAMVRSLGINLIYKKCILSSIIGAIYSVSVFLIRSNILDSLLFKLLVSFIMVCVITGLKDIYYLIKANLIFLSFSFLLAGLCIFIEISGSRNIYAFIFAFSYKDFIVAFMSVVLLVDRLYYFVKERLSFTNYIFPIEINMPNKCIQINSFLDTGNELKEPITNLPVVLVEKDLIKDEDILDDKTFFIPYVAADGTHGTMKAFKPENFKINKNGKVIEREVMVAITEAKFSKNNDYSALLNKVLLI